MLAIGDEFVFGEALEGERAVLDALVPGEEMTQIVAIAAQGRRREVVTRQTGSSGEWAFEEFLRLACAAVISTP